MDAVILAAGKGSRLNGIAAPYHKPLLVVNGSPLVRTAVEHSARAGARNIIVVAAPENAAPLNHVVPEYARMILQRTPLGPGHALLDAIDVVKSEEMLVLMADNVTTYADINKIATQPGNVIGIEMMDHRIAERFTRVRHDGSWVEKVPITDADTYDHGMVTCWVGPIKVNVAEMHRAILDWMKHEPPEHVKGTGNEVPIGPLFNALKNVSTIPVQSIDIGVPEALA